MIRLPGDISLSERQHEPAYAILAVAMNGLRCASKAWLLLAKNICEDHGLSSCPEEPCIFKGKFKTKGFTAEVVLVIYVDDILIGSSHPDAKDYVVEAFMTKVQKVKVTGFIAAGQEGKVTFLGREICRLKGRTDLLMRVPTDYLRGICEELSETDTPPKSIENKIEGSDLEPLDPNQAADFRTKLGKLAWFTQTRLDLLRYTSVLASGQAQPLRFHEKAMTKVLKYVKSNLHLWLSFQKSTEEEGLVLWVDASWGARSVSGYAIMHHGNLLKAVSKQQSTIALSSCEAELVALALGSQETLGIMSLIGFLEGYFEKEVNTFEDFLRSNPDDYSLEDGKFLFTAKTDSMSGSQVMQADGFNRRTRHLNIAILFLQRLIRKKLMCLKWTPGQHQLGDVLTKVLDKAQSTFLREQLGFREITPPEDWQSNSSRKKPIFEKPKPVKVFLLEKLNQKVVDLEVSFQECIRLLQAGHRTLVIIELCTSAGSGFAPVHGRIIQGFSIFVVQCTREHDLARSTNVLIRGIERLRRQGCIIYTHFSPPCTGGSPMQFLQRDKLDERLERYWQDFTRLLKSADRVFRESHTCSLELSRSCRYWKTKEVYKFLTKHNLQVCAYFHRCSYQDTEQNQPVAKHTYRIQFQEPVIARRYCKCNQHKPLSSQDLEMEGQYPKAMILEITNQIARNFAHRP